MSDFSPAITYLLNNEGSGYNPDDNGAGPSKFGITLRTARGFGLPWSAADIQSLTTQSATDFYHKYFWDRSHISLLTSQPVSNKVFDLLVNVGPTAILWLQQTAGTVPDGVIGPHTAAAANALSDEALLAGIRAHGESFYRSLAAEKPDVYGKDLAGWLARLAK